MRRRFLVGGFALLLVGFGTYFAMRPDPILEWELQRKQMMRAARGTKDDPIARERWEWKRLRDPKTGEIPSGIRARELAFASTIPAKEELGRQGLAKGQVFTWTQRGPVNVGGRTRAFAPDARNASILLAGGVSGGMWRSTDDGATWAKTTASGDLHNATCIVQDPRTGQQDTWYVGTGERSGNSASGGAASFLGGGIYRSTNNGVNWSLLTSTASNTPHMYDNGFDYVHRIAVDASDGEIYVAASNVIYRSTNAGLNWTIVRGTLANNSPTDVQVTSTGIVYAALNSAVNNAGIWRSTDGNTWASITPVGFPSQYSRIYMALAPSNANVVYFLVQGTNASSGHINGHQIWKYTYVSGDGTGSGGTWVNKGGSLPNESGLSGNAAFDTQGGYDMHVDVKPDNENFVIIGGINLYKTADFSATTPTWTRIGGYANANTYSSYSNHHADLHSGFFRPGSNIIYYSGHDGGLSKTADITAGTVVWSTLNNGYTTTQFYTIAVDKSRTNNIVFGGTQDNGTWWTNSSSSSTPWIAQFSGDGSYAAIATNGTHYYFSAQNGIIYRQTINETTGALVSFQNVSPTGVSGYGFINPFVLDPNDTKVMYLPAGSVIWRNSDLTTVSEPDPNSTSLDNWTQLSNTSLTGEEITAIAAGTNASGGGAANRIYFGTDIGNLYRLDNASNVSSVPSDVTDVGFPAGFVSCIAVSPSNADQALVAFSNYQVKSLFYTTDGGTSWSDVSGSLEQNPDGSGNGPSVRWAAIVPTTGGTTYFAATSTGLYSTTTLNGTSTSWVQEGATSIGNVVVDMIDYRTSDGFVAVGTHGNGVYTSNIIVSAEDVNPTIPETFELSQNFPNPFNPSTTIRFSLAERARVRIAVFDMAGREVTVLADREEDRGVHSVRWNARDERNRPVSSGVYFYRMTAVGQGGKELFSRTEKMTYVK